jgi:hypothetical protein
VEGEKIIYGIRVTAQDIDFIRKLIEENPADSRRQLSYKLCDAWGWNQPNGARRDMVCRSFLLALERKGRITLPRKRFTPPNPLAHRHPPRYIEVDQSAIRGSVGELLPLRVELVRRTPQEPLYNSLMAQHHYLGYCHPIGEQLKYLIHWGQRPIACMGWSSAVRHLRCRDEFIGWSAETRRGNLALIGYQTRFLILPWVEVKNLASYLLAAIARRLCCDWQQHYNHPVYLMETFTDPDRYPGTCYRAANWTLVGITTGRGKNDSTNRATRSRKAVWCYPLRSDFRQLMCHG